MLTAQERTAAVAAAGFNYRWRSTPCTVACSAATCSPSIRGWAGGFPAVNVGHTPGSTEVYAFVPPAQIGVTIDRGVPRVRIPKAEHAQPRRIEVSVA